LSLDPIAPAALQFALRVERLYTALTLRVPQAPILGQGSPRSEPTLGGLLLYASEFDAEARALLVAANIAGAASLAATADPAAQKQSIRDGVADFLVTDLDEALRILKNEIRKRETVAVCVAASPHTIEHEMLERGVLPDLLRPSTEPSEASPFIPQGARRIELPESNYPTGLLTWRVASAPAQWLPKLDAIATECLAAPPDAWARSAHRWLRLAPRYLGRQAQAFRLLRSNRDFYATFAESIGERIEREEIDIELELQFNANGLLDLHHFTPQAD
jgi:hypothetical protein